MAVNSVGGVSQDNLIFFYLVFGFIMFITMKGELRTYMGFFAPGSAGVAADKAATPANTGKETNSNTPAKQGTSAYDIIPGLSSDPFKGIPKSWSDFIFGGGK